jgi:hypothetical protein
VMGGYLVAASLARQYRQYYLQSQFSIGGSVTCIGIRSSLTDD